MPGEPGRLAAAAAATPAAFDLLLLGGLTGVAEEAEGVPGFELDVGMMCADARLGIPLTPGAVAPGIEATGGAEPYGVPGVDAWDEGAPIWDVDGIGKPLDPYAAEGQLAPGGKG